MLELWQSVRQAHYDAVRQYYTEGKAENAILFLRLSIRRTETLIAALQQEENCGRSDKKL